MPANTPCCKCPPDWPGHAPYGVDGQFYCKLHRPRDFFPRERKT